MTHTEIEELVDIVDTTGWIYLKSKNAPKWFRYEDQLDDYIYLSATSGSNPNNEYYCFRDREAAVEMITTTFHSQSYYDKFETIRGEIYERDEIMEAVEKRFKPNQFPSWDEMIDELDLTYIPVADLSDIVSAESKF